MSKLTFFTPSLKLTVFFPLMLLLVLVLTLIFVLIYIVLNVIRYPQYQVTYKNDDYYNDDYYNDAYGHYDPKIESKMIEDKIASSRDSPYTNNRYTKQYPEWTKLTYYDQFSQYKQFREPDHAFLWN